MEIVAIPLAASDRADLVSFLKSLSDDRVLRESAIRPSRDLRADGADGSRAHTLQDRCTIP